MSASDDREFRARASGADEESGPGLPAFLLDPKGVLVRRWPWMLAALLLGLVATAVAASLWPQRYLAQATVLITSQQIPQDFVRSTVREDSIANINAMAGKVFAQESLVRVVKEKQLFPELEGKVPPNELARRMLGGIDFARVSDFSSRGRTPETSIIYGISFTSDDPLRSAEVANTLAALFVEASISRRNEQARRTTDFLRRELERDERELRENSARITEFRTRHRGVLPNELESNSRKLDTLASRRQAIAADIAAREARIASLISLPSEAAPSPNEVLLEELRRELARQLAVNTEMHPNVIAMQARVARLEELVEQERTVGRAPSPNVKRLIDGERHEIGALRAQLGQIDAEVAELEQRVEQTPRTGEELAALEERAGVLREDYLATLRKVEAAELAENLESAQQGSQVSLLDPAVPPRAPEVSRWLVAAGGIGASLALAIALALLLELVDPVLLSNRQLEEIAELPVLGSLPRIA
jgi:uncharacterized protein involved in exopolysaccharide biosynthesis